MTTIRQTEALALFRRLVLVGALTETPTIAAGDPNRPATVIRCARCGETWDREPSEGIAVVRADRAAAAAHVHAAHPERFAAPTAAVATAAL